MKLQSIEKREEGRFLVRYNLVYETENHAKKVYEMVSRDHNLATPEDVCGKAADAVVIICTDESGEHILLNHEFRLAVNRSIYNFPAGLIDPGETVREAAVRELREETGLELYQIDDILPECYGACGFSNIVDTCLIGKARGSFAKSSSDVEEIEARWFSRKEVQELLQTERLPARTQAFLYYWSREQHE